MIYLPVFGLALLAGGCLYISQDDTKFVSSQVLLFFPGELNCDLISGGRKCPSILNLCPNYNRIYSSNGQCKYVLIICLSIYECHSLYRQLIKSKNPRKAAKKHTAIRPKLESPGYLMVENNLPAHLAKRIEELHGREQTYIEDELFSEEALTNLFYREELERAFKLNPLGPVLS